MVVVHIMIRFLFNFHSAKFMFVELKEYIQQSHGQSKCSGIY